MQTLTERLIQARLADRVVNRDQAARLLDGSAQRRYNLVNRALKAGELIRLRRGLYVVSPAVSGRLPHPFVIAQSLASGSYVSMESALAWHGLIPESVPVTLSVVPGRRAIDVGHEVAGMYRFVPLALRRGYFLQAVDRHEISGQHALVADPVRAMLDIICYRRLAPADMPDFVGSMRIDVDDLGPIGPEQWDIMTETYLHRRMRECIKVLRSELQR